MELCCINRSSPDKLETGNLREWHGDLELIGKNRLFDKTGAWILSHNDGVQEAEPGKEAGCWAEWPWASVYRRWSHRRTSTG